MKKGSPRLRFLLCDLDNTLYPPDSGVMPAVGQRMIRYITERLNLPSDDAQQLKFRYYHQYGTTMRGLILHHGIDAEDYLAFVHNVPLESYLQPNPKLEEMLTSIPLRKAVFTNADGDHARRVLDILGVCHHFERIIDVRDFGFNSKPHPIAYRRILDILDTRSDECVMVDDAADNLATAKAMGMLTVLVANGSSSGEPSKDGSDICITDILCLADAIQPWVKS